MDVNSRIPILVLGLLSGVAALQPSSCASVRYDALGASDAVGVGASWPGAAGQPNNGYVYRIDTWLNGRYSNWVLENRGVEGFTAPEIRDGELDAAIAAQPAIVTVWAGGNDIRVSIQTSQTTAALTATFQDAYATILRRLRQETSAYIVTANLPDLSRIPSAILLTASQRQLAHDDSLAVNEVITQVATTYGVPVVEVYADPQSYLPANYWIDGFHPSDAGYLLLAGKFEALLQANAWRVVSGRGDVNGDGEVTVTDAVSLLAIVAGLSEATDRQAVAGDMAPAAGDNALGIEDAVGILRRVFGLSQ